MPRTRHSHESDEGLFLAFRQERNCDALAVLFRRRVDELLRLAVFLAPRPSEAEDLVQATFLSAISRADQFHRGGRVMSWLCGILTNHARMLRRAERRELPESDSEIDLQTEPVHAALRAEVRQALDRGIANLPEPYRSVLMLYLREGLDSREISRRLQRPRATVRKQMERAIDRLRTALPVGLATALVLRMSPAQLADHAAEAASFVEPLAPEVVGGPTVTSGPGLVRGSWWWRPLLTVGAAALLTLAALLAFASPSQPRAATEPAARVTPPASNAASSDRDTMANASTPALATAERTTVDPSGRLEVIAKGYDGLPRADVELLLVPIDGRSMPEGLTSSALRRARTDSTGRADFGSLRRGPYNLALPGSLPRQRIDVRAGDNQARLELPPPTRFTGTVVDADGLRVAGAEIVVSETAGRGDIGGVVACTDAEGHFTANCPLERARVFARHAEHGRSTSWRIEGGPHVRLELRRAERTVTVTVLDQASRPLADAYVAIAPRSRAMDLVLPQHGRTDHRGRHVFGDPGAREATIVASHPSLAPATLDLAADAVSATIALSAGGLVTGTAIDANGKPMVDREVSAILAHARSNEPAGSLLGRQARTDQDGRFRLPRLPTGGMKVWIGGYDPAQSLHGFTNRYVVAGVDLNVEERAEHDVRLIARAQDRITGALQATTGTPLGGWHVVAVPARGLTFHRLARARSALTREDGTFAIAGVADRTNYRLGAFPPGARMQGRDLWPTATLPATVGGGDAKIIVDPDHGPRATLRCSVLNPVGQAARGAVVELRNREFCLPSTRTVRADGSCEFGPLPPGDYLMAVATGRSGTVTVPLTMPTDGSDLDLGTLQLELPARLFVNLSRADGRSARGVRVVGRHATGDKFVTAYADAAGQAALPVLPPGPTEVLVHGPGIAPIVRRLELTDGPQWLEVDLETATNVAVQFRFAPVENPFVIDGPLMVEVRDRDGELVFCDNIGGAIKPGVFQWKTGLPAGDYEVRATSMWNARVAVDLHVAPGSRPVVDALLQL